MTIGVDLGGHEMWLCGSECHTGGFTTFGDGLSDRRRWWSAGISENWEITHQISPGAEGVRFDVWNAALSLSPRGG